MGKDGDGDAGVRLDPKQKQHQVVEGRGDDIEAQVRARAFEIFEARGRRPGHALDDWLLAERQMLGRRVDTLVESWREK